MCRLQRDSTSYRRSRMEAWWQQTNVAKCPARKCPVLEFEPTAIRTCVSSHNHQTTRPGHPSIKAVILHPQVSAKKVNLSVGGFESDAGNGGHNFRVVKKVEMELAQACFLSLKICSTKVTNVVDNLINTLRS